MEGVNAFQMVEKLSDGQIGTIFGSEIASKMIHRFSEINSLRLHPFSE